MCAYGLQARKRTVLCKRSQPGLLSLYFANMKQNCFVFFKWS